MASGAISDCQVIVIDDASSDATPILLEMYPWVETIRLFSQSGYGSALKTGFAKASGEWIAFLDLDGTYDPVDLEKLLVRLKEPGAEFILGERLSLEEGMPPLRLLGNHFFNWLVRNLYKQSIRDACTGCRIFHSRWVQRILELPNDGLDYSLAMTLWALKNKVSIHEVPIQYRSRNGRSKLSIIMDGSRFLWTILSGHPAYAIPIKQGESEE